MSFDKLQAKVAWICFFRPAHLREWNEPNCLVHMVTYVGQDGGIRMRNGIIYNNYLCEWCFFPNPAHLQSRKAMHSTFLRIWFFLFIFNWKANYLPFLPPTLFWVLMFKYADSANVPQESPFSSQTCYPDKHGFVSLTNISHNLKLRKIRV